MAIKIGAFMNAYKFRKTDEEKDKFLKEHLNNEYIPYEKKADVAKAIVNTSYWKSEVGVDGKEHKVLYIDSIAKYMLTCMAIVDLFTDIERQKSDGKMLEDFNTLNGSGILDFIIQNVNQRELKEFNMILELTCEDVIANEFENHAFISKQIDRFGGLIGTVLAPFLDKIDVDKIQEIMNEIK